MSGKKRDPDPSDGFDEAVSRRTALRRLGLVGTSALVPAALASCRQPPWEKFGPDPTGLAVNKPDVPGSERWATAQERTISSSCAQCPAGCGIRVRVVEGRAVRIEGNATNPINQGGIGIRGLSALQGLYDSDRLEGPMVRQGDKLVPITWKAGFDLLVSKLGELRKRGAAHKLLVMSGRERGFMHELWARFCRAYGTPNLTDGRPSRSAVMAQAMAQTLGHSEMPAFDWTGADYVLSLEAGLLEDSCQAVYYTRAAGERHRGAGGHRAKLVHAGISFDLSAHNADEWLPIRPGTSGALALGLCHLLVKERRFDAAFVQRATAGFESPLTTGGEPGFRAFLETFTPERVAALTGIGAQVIQRLARELAGSRAAFAFVDERSLSFSNGWETALAVLSLNALLGAIERPAGGLRLEPQPPYAPWPPFELDELARAGLAQPRMDRAGTPEFPLATSVHETLRAAMESDAGPEAALLYYANPAYSRHQPLAWQKALKRIPFVVSFSPYRDETVDTVAHLVLPDHTFLERWEDAGAAPSTGRPTAGLRQPIIEPLHNTTATGDVLLLLARELGPAVGRAFPWETFRDAMVARQQGLFQAKRGTIVAPTEHAFFKRILEEGFWAETAATAGLPVRFQFQSRYSPPQWEGDPVRFPLLLIGYRPLGYAEGSGANQPWTRMQRSRAHITVWHHAATMHPTTAPAHAKKGALVTVSSPFGAVTLPLMLDERMAKGYVAVPAGAGHTAFGRWAKGFGTNLMDLLRPGAARLTGANVLCDTRVRVELAAHAAKKEG